ncbi:MAG TPA: hypothetical protein P5572_04420 [Phycisphaerae bacterium]|nr:hypothetical protein [Phycisphaerales bacterium]HRX84244.1 hypothetical protein [Phycisphaerae bacterium]
MLDLARQLNDSSAPSVRLDVGPPRPRRSGCRAPLAALLAGMCLLQVSLANGMWLWPYLWWQLRVLPHGVANSTDVRVKLTNENDVYFELRPKHRAPDDELARR